MSNMDRESLEYLRAHLGRATCFNIEEREVFDREVFNPPRPDIPLPKIRLFATLAGLAQYVIANPDDIDLKEGWMIHVSEPHVVDLCKAPNKNGHRDIRVRVVCFTQKNEEWLDRWVSQEDLLIGLLGCASGGDRDVLVKGVQSIKRELCEVSELADGGQKVSANYGVGLTEWLRTDSSTSKDDLDLNKVVKLAPYRTFCEIQQPVGIFVFRIRRGGEGMTQVKLITTPDATWAVEAVSSVKKKLEELLKDAEHAPPVIC